MNPKTYTINQVVLATMVIFTSFQGGSTEEMTSKAWHQAVKLCSGNEDQAIEVMLVVNDVLQALLTEGRVK